jgi:hypothetical protein
MKCRALAGKSFWVVYYVIHRSCASSVLGETHRWHHFPTPSSVSTSISFTCSPPCESTRLNFGRLKSKFWSLQITGSNFTRMTRNEFLCTLVARLTDQRKISVSRSGGQKTEEPLPAGNNPPSGNELQKISMGHLRPRPI